MEQVRMTERAPLLDKNGSLTKPGWATELLYEYDPKAVKANKIRLKEWDYYIMISDEGEYALALCIADNRYMGLVDAALIDIKNGVKHDFLVPLILPMGKLHLPTDSGKGDVIFRNAFCDFRYILTDGGRRLLANYHLPGGKTFECNIFLQQPKMDTMVIATPWKEDPKAFYYNQKINCMRAEGFCEFDGQRYTFSPKTDFGTLDWGRGVWTYDNTWYWGSGNMDIDGHAFGYNIGYGFGDTAAASENMLFYDGVCHKLDRVQFVIPEDDIMKPWKFTETNHRFEMDFVPLFDHRTDISAVVISQDAHQVFGRLSGTAVLDDGTKIQVQNKLVFAERVHNRY